MSVGMLTHMEETRTPDTGMGETSTLDFASLIQPVPATAVFGDSRFNIWCGSMVRGAAGRCHLYYSRWPRSLGHHGWVTASEVAHAVADHPLGPYRHVDVALPARDASFWDGRCTHNPTVMAFADKYYLYYMGNTGDGVTPPSGLNWTHRNHQRIGVAVADDPAGPWTRFDKPLIEPTPGFHDALMCSNPTVCVRPDGGFLMIYKGVSAQRPLPFGGPVVHLVASGESPTGPFEKHPLPIFTAAGVAFPAEDPFVWCDGSRYWAIVKDFGGHFTGVAGPSLALFESHDGFDWRPATHPLVSRLELRRADGTVRPLNALERPQLWLDADQRPAVLFCAAAADATRDASFNVAIPLRRDIF